MGMAPVVSGVGVGAGVGAGVGLRLGPSGSDTSHLGPLVRRDDPLE